MLVQSGYHLAAAARRHLTMRTSLPSVRLRCAPPDAKSQGGTFALTTSISASSGALVHVTKTKDSMQV
jgi:hypothetical protein